MAITQLSPANMTGGHAKGWWEHEGIDRGPDGRLRVAGHDAETLAREHGTPLIAYDPARVAETTVRFRDALRRTGLPTRLRFAIKANREPEVLAVLRGMGDVGIDACSPGEVLHAMGHGWAAAEVSYTGTNVSERDLDVILPTGVHLNVDAVSQVERVGRRAPGRSIGLRVNPGLGVGWTDELAYSGERPTKFGIYPERLPEAMDVAARHHLVIDTVHCHAGSGWLGDGLPAFARTMERVAEITRALIDAGCPIAEVNVGGGLGVPARNDEPAIDLDAYAATLASTLGPLGVAIACEPGDYLVKDCAVMLAEVVTIEDRGGTRFVGLDTGWNTDCGYFIYRFTKEILPVVDPAAERSWRVTVAGNINEVGDVFATDYPIAPVAEGDVVALFWAGGYAQGMASYHCLREPARTVFLER
jgi:diaminopimelate decarboxylase